MSATVERAYRAAHPVKGVDIRQRHRAPGLARAASETATRSLSDARLKLTPKRATPLPSSPATRQAFNGRSFGPSTSFAR
jgi:hypothetical protein